MSSRRRWRGRRLILFCALSLLIVTLTGCVYLRLLQLKRQLADFDRHFTLQTTTGIRLTCLEPVLLADDVAWLGFAPARREAENGNDLWHLRWIKQRPRDTTEAGTFEIAFDLAFANERLTGIFIPEAYFAALPKAVVVNGIKSLGGANVNKSKRSVESQVLLALEDSTQAWPTRATFLTVLGRPTEESAGDGKFTWHYHFVSADPARKGKDIDLKFVFDASTEKLVQTHGRLPVGRINLNFTEAASRSAAPAK